MTLVINKTEACKQNTYANFATYIALNSLILSQQTFKDNLVQINFHIMLTNDGKAEKHQK